MNIILTGGCGLLGSYCAENFYKDKDNVTIIERAIPEYTNPWIEKFNVVLDDITSQTIYDKIPENYYDCMVHFAAADRRCSENPQLPLIINTFGTKNMLEVCVKKGIKRFVYISTFQIYGSQPDNCFITESTEPHPANEYGMTHYFGENYAKQYSLYNNMTCTSMRISNCYSAPMFKKMNRWNNVPNIFIYQAVNDRKIIINSSGKYEKNFLSALDLYKAIRLVIQKQSSIYEVFNVGGRRNYTIREIADIVHSVGEKLLGLKPIEIITQFGQDEKSPVNFHYDISKIEALGYAPSIDIVEDISNSFCNLIGGNN